MALREEWDRILNNWALWLLGGRGGSGYASPVYAMGVRGPRVECYMPLLLAEATDIDTMIHQLPREQQNAVVAWHVRRADRLRCGLASSDAAKMPSATASRARRRD